MSLVNALKSGYHVLQGVKAELLDQKTAGRNVIVRPDDVWLVSYPKSGNTWTRFLLANMIFRHTAVGFDNIEKLVPDIYQHSEYYLQSTPPRRYLKSHEYFDPRYKTVILIVRDPRDIAVSYYHHMVNFGTWSEDSSIDDFVGQFINGSFTPFGSWGENVGSWMGSKCANHKVLLLRYEDMLKDTDCAIRKVGDFLGVDIPHAEAGEISKCCSVESMQALERKQGSQWKPIMYNHKGNLFVRRGKSGVWREDLQAELASKITSVWKKQMEVLGYVDA